MGLDDGLVQTGDRWIVRSHVGEGRGVHAVFGDAQPSVVRALHQLPRDILPVGPFGEPPVELVGELVDPEVDAGLHPPALGVGQQVVQQLLGGANPFLVGLGPGHVRVHQLGTAAEELAPDGLSVNRHLPSVMEHTRRLGLVPELKMDEGLMGIDLAVQDIELQLGQLIDEVPVVVHSVEDERRGQVVDGPVGAEPEPGLLDLVQAWGRERGWAGGKHVLFQQKTDPQLFQEVVNGPKRRRRAASPHDHRRFAVPGDGLQDQSLVADTGPSRLAHHHGDGPVRRRASQDQVDVGLRGNRRKWNRLDAVQVAQVAAQLAGGVALQFRRLGSQDDGAVRGGSGSLCAAGTQHRDCQKQSERNQDPAVSTTRDPGFLHQALLSRAQAAETDASNSK